MYWRALLLLLLLPSCYPLGVANPRLDKPVALSPQRQAKQALENARRFRAADNYEGARDSYRQLIDLAQGSPSAGVTVADLAEARQGMCRMLIEMHSYEWALRNCKEGVDAGVVDASVLETVTNGLRQDYGKWIDQRLAKGSSSSVEEKIAAYKALSGAKAERITGWEKKLATVKSTEKKKRDQEAKERKRVEAEAERQRLEQSKQARLKLEDKWNMAKTLSAAQFRNWVMINQTVIGQQFFSDVEIEKPRLSLWVNDPDRLASASNLGFFADIADAFVVWCECEGETLVGIDMSHLGQRKMAVYRYHFNSQTGRSQLSR